MNRSSPRSALASAGSQTALSQKAELVFRHRTLQPKQQPVVGQTRIVGPVQVDNQRAGQGAQVYQMMPVPSVPSEPGSLDAEHRADRPGAHRGGELLEPGRSEVPEPERPRSSSMTVTDGNPAARAVSASAY